MNICTRWKDIGPQTKRTALNIVLITRVTTGVISTAWDTMGNNQYMALAVAYAMAMLGAWLVRSVCVSEGCGLCAAVERAGGRFLADWLRFFSIVYLVLSAQNTLYKLTGITIVLALPGVRFSPVAVAAAAAAALAAISGIKGVMRYARLMSYVVTAGVIIVVLLSLGSLRMSRLFPIFGRGPGVAASVGVSAFNDFFTVLIIGMLYDPAQDTRREKRLFFLVPTLSFAVCLGFFLLSSMTAPYTAGHVDPMFDLLHSLSAGNTLQTAAGAFIVVWNSAFLITIAVQTDFASMLACDLLRVREEGRERSERWACVLFSAVVLTLALLPRKAGGTPAWPGSLLVSPGNLMWLLLYVPVLWTLVSGALRRGREARCAAR